MMQQLDLFAPPPIPPIVTDYVPFDRFEVETRAFIRPITIYSADDIQPFEVEVRGVPTVISNGFCTHAINGPGSAYWSETGFRSFGYPTDDPSEVIAAIEHYIDTPVKSYGCGGKLTRWWPCYVLQWRQSLAFELSMVKQLGGRDKIWDQWGPEAWEDHWHKHDMKLQDAVEQMVEDGIDPNDVGPPPYHKGKWPRIEVAA